MDRQEYVRELETLMSFGKGLKEYEPKPVGTSGDDGFAMVLIDATDTDRLRNYVLTRCNTSTLIHLLISILQLMLRHGFTKEDLREWVEFASDPGEGA